MRQNTPPDGGYFADIDLSNIFGQISNNDADHVNDNKDNNLENFDADDVDENEDIFDKASVGFNKNDADANQDIFDEDNDNLGIFDADNIEGIKDISLDDVNGDDNLDGLFTNDSSEAKSNDYVYSKKEEEEQLVKMMIPHLRSTQLGALITQIVS